MTRFSLTKAAPQSAVRYGESTRREVERLASALETLFWLEQSGKTSPTWAKTLERLFALWCEQSGIVPTGRARRAIRALGRPTQRGLRQVVEQDLGFTGSDVRAAMDDYVQRARVLRGRRLVQAEDDLLRALYKSPAHSLCMQSAHVALARAVLYRVLEDRGSVPARISGNSLRQTVQAAAQGMIATSSTPVMTLLEDMRNSTESFLPLLYNLRELDWWLVPTPRTNTQQQLFHQTLQPVEVALQSMLNVLDQYDFSAVDRDVWKDVYQHHLPWEERQRLGSFYTPDPLVELTLDAAGWKADAPLLERNLADISCGSGAFLVEALLRRRQALEKSTPGDLKNTITTQQLDNLVEGIVGFDIHPFATFLASVNLVFVVIDLYEAVLRRNRSYSLPLNIFTVDALEDAGAHPRQVALQKGLPQDIRIRHTEEEIKRYRRLRGRRFDVVVGNPPWGGMLKGKLSPLHDEQKRREYRSPGRFDSATGKYDFYVLFIERSLSWLTEGGSYGLLVPNTYLDKDFGKGIRAVLSSAGMPHLIVDLGPFGQVFFNAMNTPSLLVGRRGKEQPQVHVVAARRELAVNQMPQDRQRVVVDAVKRALGGHSTANVDAFTEAVTTLKGSVTRGWYLDVLAGRRPQIAGAGGLSAGACFDVDQGVTPAGEGALKIFRMPPDVAKQRGLEADLIHPALGGTDVTRWGAQPSADVMLYPYYRSPQDPDAWLPAFSAGAHAPDLLNPYPKGAAEEQAVSGLSGEDARRRLYSFRAARTNSPYPETARFLLENFDQLASRRPKEKPITDFGRRWYEFLWPRTQRVMLSKRKIVGRRYQRWPTYALDESGALPSDACVVLGPPVRVNQGHHGRLVDGLSNLLGRRVTEREVLLYALAFLNSSASAFMLRVGRNPTPKGSWSVNEEVVASVPLAISPQAAMIITESDALVTDARQGLVDKAREAALDTLVLDSLQLDAQTRRDVETWVAANRPASF